VINAPGTTELLKVDARHQAAQAVADQVDAATSHVPPEIVSQGDRCLFHAAARPVIEEEDVAKPAPAKISRER
jgi:hypothetical protein